MRKFLKRIALFATIVLTILAIGEVVVRNIPDSYSYKHQFITGHGHEIATLILGSSHTYYGVRSDLLADSVFNLANVSQTPDLDLALLKHYLDNLPNLRRIVIPISYFTFVDPKLEDTNEWFRCIGYKVSMHLPEHSDFSKYNFEIADFEGYSAKLRGLAFKAPSNKCDSLGWGLGFSLADRSGSWENQGKERAAATTLPLTGRADEVEVILGETISFCRSRGIECVFVTTPAWHTYRENLDRAQLADMQQRAARISSLYRVPYLNLFADPDFTADDFHDVDHLSDLGAAKFTSRLRSILPCTVINPCSGKCR